MSAGRGCVYRPFPYSTSLNAFSDDAGDAERPRIGGRHTGNLSTCLIVGSACSSGLGVCFEQNKNDAIDRTNAGMDPENALSNFRENGV